jgi:hypothetical protein
LYNGVCRAESGNPHHLRNVSGTLDDMACLEAFVRERIFTEFAKTTFVEQRWVLPNQDSANCFVESPLYKS